MKRLIIVLVLLFFILLSIGLVIEYSNSRSQVGGARTVASSSPTLKPTATRRETDRSLRETPQSTEREEAKVVKVIDGDTITVLLHGKTETVRVIGIDTPETVDPRKSIECFGVAASNRAKQLLASQTVMLESDSTQGDRDSYQRLLRYVWINSSTSSAQNWQIDYGLETIREGFAHEYTYQIPYKYQNEYKQAQSEAQKKKKGLWADNACVTPTPTKVSISITPTTNQTTKHQTTQSSSVPTENRSYRTDLTGDKDCKDFTTHQEAQDYFIAKGGSSTNNVDNLDADHDGLACESLP